MHPSTGGPPVVVDRWCRELSKIGVDVAVMTTDSYAPNQKDRDWINDYATGYSIDVCTLSGPKGYGFGTGMRNRFCLALPKLDLVHVHNLWGYSNRLAAKYCPRYGVPFVVSTHGMLDPHSVARKGLKKRLYGDMVEWPALRRAAAIVVTHKEEYRLAEQSVKNLPRGYVVALGADNPPSEDRALLRQDFLRSEPHLIPKQRLLFMGRLHEKKGLDLLIPAFAELSTRCPDSHLIIAGPGEPNYVAHLKRRVASLRLEHWVTFVGPLHGERKWGALAAADAFVLPSYQENFAISVVEALRIGTPVIVSDRINIASDLVQAGVAKQTDLTVNGLCNAMQSMLADSAARELMGSRGRELVIKKYSWQRSCSELVKVYRELLSNESQPAA